MAVFGRTGLDHVIAPDGSPGLRETVLKNLRTAVVTGGAAAASLTCADGDGVDIKLTATILSAVAFNAGVPQNREAPDVITIPTVGDVAFATTDTTGMTIIVEYINHD